MSHPKAGSRTFRFRRSFAFVGLALGAAAAAVAQTGAPEQTAGDAVAEELVVVESSVLLQRSDRSRIESLAVTVDGVAAKALAVYRLTEVDFPTVVYMDLCAPSFSRLTRAVGMVATIGELLLARGPVSVVTGAATESEVLLEASRDALSFEAALTVILRSELGGCEDATALAALDRMRRALGPLEGSSISPGLLLFYGFDHGALDAKELERYQPEFAAVGAELAGRGHTPVALLPGEGDRRLEEKEVRSLLPDPEGPPRVINLGAVLGAILSPKRYVPDDPRILAIATDPRNELVRELVAPGHGRLLSFARQAEAFVRELGDYHLLFYRSTYRRSEASGTLVPISVRTRAGELVETVRVTRRSPRSPQ